MLYCARCQSLCEDDRHTCPNCKGKKLRPPEENDPVFLITAGKLDAGRISAALSEQEIPFETRVSGPESSAPAAYLGTAPASAARFFVPFGAMEKSREALEGIGIFNEDGEAAYPGEDEEECDMVEEDSKEMSPVKRFVWRVISVVLFILLIWAVVAATDGVIGLVEKAFLQG